MKLAKQRAKQSAPGFSGEFAVSSRPSGVNHSVPGTYAERAESELFRLCIAIGQESEFERNLESQRVLMQGWGEVGVPGKPPYESAIGDDHSPYEFSLAFEPGAVELRLLVEAQARDPALGSNRDAALALNASVFSRYELDERRFVSTRDLFLDGTPAPPFSLWHAVCWNPGKPPEFKLYLNPQVRGRGSALPLVAEALARLGFGERHQTVLKRLLSSPNDEIRYFSLDLSRGSASRVKVYAAHHAATATELERKMALSPHHRSGDATEFCRAMVESEGPFLSKPITTCVSFVEGSTEPHAMTMHLPVAHYVDSDAITVRRVGRYLRARGLDDAVYRRAVHGLAARSLEEGVGLQSYASYRRENDCLRFTAYLSPQIFA